MSSLQKLGYKDQVNAVVLNKPEELIEDFKGLKKELNVSEKYSFVVVFLPNKKALEDSIDNVMKTLAEDYVLWFAYPKISSGVETDINRDSGWDALKKYDLLGVRQVSLSDTWSALRFKERKDIKSITRKFE